MPTVSIYLSKENYLKWVKLEEPSKWLSSQLARDVARDVARDDLDNSEPIIEVPFPHTPEQKEIDGKYFKPKPQYEDEAELEDPVDLDELNV